MLKFQMDHQKLSHRNHFVYRGTTMTTDP